MPRPRRRAATGVQTRSMPQHAAGLQGAGLQPPDPAAINLLRMVFVAEVYSVETFRRMLETYEGLSTDQRCKIEACRRLAALAVQRLQQHLAEDLGLALRPPRRARQAAEVLAPLIHASWGERMKEFEALATRGVMTLRNLKSIYGDREPNLCATLLAKDMAFRDFARDELDGHPQRSLDPVLALLPAQDRGDVEAGAGV